MCATKKAFLILHEEKDFLIVIKSRGISSAPLTKRQTETLSLAELIFQEFPETKKIESKTDGEGGLLHRLDRDTQGLVLIARNQLFYDHIQQQSTKGLFKKSYLAYCLHQQPTLPPQGYTIDSWTARLRNFTQISCTFSCSFVKAEAHSSRVRAIQHQSRHSKNTIYTTSITLNRRKDHIVAECCIKQGFRHQVRASLCALGLPIIGDPFYPDEEEKNEEFSFWATRLSFTLPGSESLLKFNYHPKSFVNRF